MTKKISVALNHMLVIELRFMIANIRNVAAIMMFMPILACAIDIVDARKGFNRTENATPFREIKQKYGYRPAFLVNADSENVYYGLSRDGSAISYYDMNDNKVLGWPLTRWGYLQRPIEILKDHSVVGNSPWKEKIEYTANLPYPGCLNLNPLRYVGNGSNDIVLFLNGELVIFSPEYQRTIFSMFVDASDVFSEPLVNASLESDLEAGVSYQYLSEYLMFNGIKHRAHKSFSKIYFGDYDGDGSQDILTWQKIYVSNMIGQADGFSLVANEFKHYEQDIEVQKKSVQGVTGEYLPQETNPEIVQEWLGNDQLTWQMGYPTASECVGKEGEIIPEMHSPMLNDPEVLN